MAAFAFATPSASAAASCPDLRRISVLSGESWFGGVVSCGLDMPWTAATKGFSRDLRKANYTNQTSPMLISDKGRWIWCDDPFAFSFDGGEIVIEASGSAPVETGEAPGDTLRDAYLAVMRAHFPPEGAIPDPLLFTAPQYNTWIELNYHQNQKDMMSYASGIVDNGFPPGVVMIDDTWQTDYGV